MSDFSYYLHEKAEESRHNESMGLLVAAIGSVLLVGGLMQTIGTMQELQLFPMSISQLWSSPTGFLGFSFTILGLILFLAGLILAVYYGSHRSWYFNTLKERYRIEEEELRTPKKEPRQKI